MASDYSAIKQSAVLPYRWRKGKLEILLVTSLDTGRWVIPKGNIAAGLTARGSAIKEAFEEAGITGKTAEESIGAFNYAKTELKGGWVCRVDVFPMRVKEEVCKWPEKGQRHREWKPLGAAAAVVDEDELRRLMLKFGEALRPD